MWKSSAKGLWQEGPCSRGLIRGHCLLGTCIGCLSSSGRSVTYPYKCVLMKLFDLFTKIEMKSLSCHRHFPANRSDAAPVGLLSMQFCSTKNHFCYSNLIIIKMSYKRGKTEINRVRKGNTVHGFACSSSFFAILLPCQSRSFHGNSICAHADKCLTCSTF